jgi:hypothetical protein
MLKNRDASNYTSLSSPTPEKKARTKENPSSNSPASQNQNKPKNHLPNLTGQKHPNKPTKV